MRVLIVYHFFEKDETYRDNLLHFLRFAYVPDADFVVSISGRHSIALPAMDNIRYLNVPNRNYDYGGYVAALATVENIGSYDAFLFVNSSVRGPFVPAYHGVQWYRPFTDLFAEDVGLVGSTINDQAASESAFYRQTYGGTGLCPHVQTMAYAMPARTMRFLQERGFYADGPTLSKDECIRDYELRLSQLVLENGWQIKCLLPEYNMKDYRSGSREPSNSTALDGDPNWPFGYYGRTPHPFETVFVKTERGLYSIEYLKRLSASMNAALGSRAGGQAVPGTGRVVADVTMLRDPADAVVAETHGFHRLAQLARWQRVLARRRKAKRRALKKRRAKGAAPI